MPVVRFPPPTEQKIDRGRVLANAISMDNASGRRERERDGRAAVAAAVLGFPMF